MHEINPTRVMCQEGSKDDFEFTGQQRGILRDPYGISHQLRDYLGVLRGPPDYIDHYATIERGVEILNFHE